MGEEKKKQITVWQAACIITGYGIGGGVLAMPYLASKIGFGVAMIVLVLAFAASYVLHLMIADTSLKCGEGSQVVTIFSRFLFKGKAKTVLTVAFFILMAVVLISNLAAYVSGAADEIVAIFPGMPLIVAKIIFYILAASVVMFGLRAVAISEEIMVVVIFIIIGVLIVASMFNINNPLPMDMGAPKEMLAYFGMAMFAFSAFFSVPQAVQGLAGDVKKVKKAIFIGLGNNFVLVVLIMIAAFVSSKEMTELVITGWAEGIGKWAVIAGAVFTVFAMLTTYWSVSLALSEIVEQQLKLNNRLCWLIATAPSFILGILPFGGFMGFLKIAAGAIGIIVAAMFIPTYRRAKNEIPGGMLDKAGSTPVQILVLIAYIGMALGNLM